MTYEKATTLLAGYIKKKKKKTWAKEAFVYCLFALTLVGKFNCLVPEPIPHRC